MDVNKVFGLFGGEDESPKPDFDHENDKSYLLEDFKKHPLFWVGMFKKLIHNHRTFSKKIIGFFSRMDEELDLYDVEQAGEFVVYNRAFFWINKIDVTEKSHQDAIIRYADDYLLTYLKFSISYFQDLEEYEKCAHLKKIQDIVEELLN
jgi:hypothetical protein